MRPPESFIGQPIRSLQTMLRFIAESRGDAISIIPDGIYGQNTVNAVSDFQRRKGMPVTGITDQTTWDAIAAEYENAVILVGDIEDYPDIFLVQAILSVLSQVYASVTPPGSGGILDIPTAESLASFQALSGLASTGELDRITWHHLALQYPLAARQLLDTDSPQMLQYS